MPAAGDVAFVAGAAREGVGDGPPGKPGESSRRDTGKQDGQGGKGRSPGSRDEDEDDRDQPRDRDRRGPGRGRRGNGKPV